MSDVEFGDMTPEDAYDAEGRAEAMPVARFIFNWRRDLVWLSGQLSWPVWWELDQYNRDAATSIAQHGVIDVINEGHPTALDLAVAIHANRDEEVDWKFLPRDSQLIALALAKDILNWLEREGSI